MTLSDPGSNRGPTRLDFPAREIPHMTLEINRTCNMHCRCCYNIDRSWVKSFEEVERDLDRAMTLRRLQAVTVLGGEPTLHPELPRIVALVKSRGLHCQLLTNGLRFLAPDGPGLLRDLKRAGIDKILLHVDGGQAHVHGDIEAAREKLFWLMETEGVEFALSVTVYNEDRGFMSGIVRRYARFRHFEGVLAVLARDPATPAAQTVELREEDDGLRAGLGIEPTAYVPSNLSDTDARWLIYFYLVDAAGTGTYPLSARFDRAFRLLFRVFSGRHLYATNHGPAELRRIIVPIVLFESLTSPRRLPRIARLLRRAGSLKFLRLHFIAIQVPPELGPDGEIAVICRGCPDATVRDGRLVPVCVADLVAPRTASPEPLLACPEIWGVWADAAARLMEYHRHMGAASRSFQVFVKPAGAACNLACDYCYYLGKGPAEPGTTPRRMPEDLLETYIRQHIAASCDNVIRFSWHGGEPTVLGIDYFRKIVEIERRFCPQGRTIANGLQTNGTLLDDDWGRFLAAEGFSVGLSLDGPEDVHDRHRRTRDGRTSFDGAMRGWDVLHRFGVPADILCVVGSPNAGRPLDVYGFFRKIGASYVTFLPLVEPRPGAPGGVSPVTVRPEAWGDLLCAVFDEWVEHDIGRVKIQIVEEAARTAFGQEHSLCIFRPVCGDVPVLERNGDLYSCDHYVDPAHRLGNIRVTPLADLLESPAQRGFGLAKKGTLPGVCRGCEVLDMCNGECPKNRFALSPDGEPGLNYLCAGYKKFFGHVRPFVAAVAEEWRRQNPGPSS